MARIPRILSIPAGAPFLATFADRLLAGKVIEAIGPHTPPLELSAATIYVPTRRAARALAVEIAKRLPGPAVLLPKIIPLGHLENIETALIFDPLQDFSADAPESIDPIDRRLALMHLIHAWAQKLAHAITHFEGGEIRTDPNEALLVAQAPAQAWHLAGDLAALIDEMIVEGADWTRLQNLAPHEFDKYWSVTIEFLKIASQYWPAELKERGLVDPPERQRLLVEREIERLSREGFVDPVIAIGSTGTNQATARLLASISRARNGAVVLPGLDKKIDTRAFSMIGGDPANGLDPAAGHPQAALNRLLPVLGVTRDNVDELGATRPSLVTRMELVGEAFRPADSTENWRDYIARTDRQKISDALAGLTMIVAADEREEALALALNMRATLETPGKTAALITPDRALARRVRAELARWNIEVDDSGGEPLATSSYGVLARLALTAAGAPCKPREWIALLAHPLVHLNWPRETLRELARLLETGVLRGVLTHRDNPRNMVAAARAAASDKYAHPAVQRIDDRQWAAIDDLVMRLVAALQPLQAREEKTNLRHHIEAHRATLAQLTEGALYQDESFESFEMLFTKISEADRGNVPFGAHDYAALVDHVMREEIVRGPAHAHPRLKILGLLEARLIEADVMLLAGLDETIWPPQTETGAFLNRPMRAELGLTPPERRIGQTAHDFIQALGTEHVVISRAMKRGGSPSVPSRFLQRLEALAGDAFAICKMRGEEWLALARRIDRPQNIMPVTRPEPKPALELRPDSLSVTDIETLRRDPYAIFARHVLKLAKLEKIGAEPGAREAGTQVHDVLAEFVIRHPHGDLPEDSLEQLHDLAHEKLSDLLKDADYRAFQWPRIEAGLSLWLDWERERRADLIDSKIELYGRLTFNLADGSTFALRGKADRIDLMVGGGCQIIDYKTGKLPTEKEIAAGFAPQLPLEMIMVQQGAFTAVGALDVRNALHVKFGEGAVPIAGKKGNAGAIAQENFDGLVTLLNQFRDEATPYIPRPFPQFLGRFSDYDHLARVKEWSAGAGEGDES